MHFKNSKKDIYKKSTCEMRQLIDQVVALCNCRPDYLHNFLIVDKPEVRKCNFYDQVKCVAHVIERKGLTKNTVSCKPACQSYEFHQENIQEKDSS
ncbi:Oidioi.mRNA.OKI2018_I69.chr1.g1061.t1.cds [Oikopleura dioica]|uniref:Oidioi.mRNA.OKI2018_I69.chr1.g1061.t1.cds n=1 Tax=Oikopleura dioica TaxID=34765 RepID=A0ABN7SLS2_OIKDI|nr:Oidioi.mRNA.OKI2018_I69.chr1.g1061.t1.cds [Oikopleura dioica]